MTLTSAEMTAVVNRIKRGMRLSVQPVDKAHVRHVIKLGGSQFKL